MNPVSVTPQEIEELYRKLEQEAQAVGYRFNPDQSFTRALIESLLINEKRYGYQVCPCRLAAGSKVQDLDIICPCDYRDPDLNDFGSCFCALYVTEPIARGEMKAKSIRDRRPIGTERIAKKTTASLITLTELPHPVWRCNVCGYLCAREKPPEICPICKARHERFERFL